VSGLATLSGIIALILYLARRERPAIEQPVRSPSQTSYLIDG